MATTPLLGSLETNPEDYTTTSTVRDTKDGRRLHYELTCLQQPERARACGSGQKSAADRRPVDPPPVIQLRVFEGPNRKDAKDITPTYLSSFFVYADLQHARPIANGRVQTPAATSHPVLTGSPVSGMVLLDRPVEAGYFLFPDLSVRHEGRYVLGFTLYEEIKNEGDGDAEPMDEDPTPGFYLRMRVVSNPFSVYSAKKFPGLSCSTDLSRTISEQGCRVRIRRDVRMRRRGDKRPSGAEFKEEEPNRSRRSPSPVDTGTRDRSASHSSQQREPYAAKPVERRPSEVSAGYPAQPPASSHMRYGSDMSNAPHGPQYIQPAPQGPPPISPSSATYSSQPSPYATAPPPQHYPYQSRPAPYVPTTPVEAYDRRSSTATAVPPSPSHPHFAPAKEEYRRESLYMPEPEQSRIPEPPRRDSQPLSAGAAPPAKHTFTLPPLADICRGAPKHPGSSFPGPSAYSGPSRMAVASDYIEPAPMTMQPRIEEPARAGSKRGFNDVFHESTQSLRDGQRPQENHHLLGGRPSLCDYHDDGQTMAYPRADGTVAWKTANVFGM